MKVAFTFQDLRALITPVFGAQKTKKIFYSRNLTAESNRLRCCWRQWCESFILPQKWSSQRSQLLSSPGHLSLSRSSDIPTEFWFQEGGSSSLLRMRIFLMDEIFSIHRLEDFVQQFVQQNHTTKLQWIFPWEFVKNQVYKTYIPGLSQTTGIIKTNLRTVSQKFLNKLWIN